MAADEARRSPRDRVVSDHKRSLLERTTEIVMSYAANNTFDPDRLPQLLKEVHRALRELGRADRQDPPPPRLPTSDIGFYVAALATFLGGGMFLVGLFFLLASRVS